MLYGLRVIDADAPLVARIREAGFCSQGQPVHREKLQQNEAKDNEVSTNIASHG